jgi:hypothetical protein
MRSLEGVRTARRNFSAAAARVKNRNRLALQGKSCK